MKIMEKINYFRLCTIVCAVVRSGPGPGRVSGVTGVEGRRLRGRSYSRGELQVEGGPRNTETRSGRASTAGQALDGGGAYGRPAPYPPPKHKQTNT